MKQGQGVTYVDRKRNPIANKISVAAVSQIGQAMGNKATDVPGTLRGGSKSLYSGRDFEAPHDAGRTIHQGGSQRRHD